MFFFFFKQKTAYEIVSRDWSSDVCSSDLPRLLTMQVKPDQIGMVIGPGGKQIKAITEATGAKVDIQDDGTVTISAVDSDKADRKSVV